MLEQLFLAGMIIEECWGAPQDIEWAYESGRKRLVILQVRPITATAGSPEIAAEQERVAEIACAARGGPKGEPVFRSSAVGEVVSSPTRMTRSLIEHERTHESGIAGTETLTYTYPVESDREAV